MKLKLHACRQNNWNTFYFFRNSSRHSGSEFFCEFDFLRSSSDSKVAAISAAVKSSGAPEKKTRSVRMIERVYEKKPIKFVQISESPEERAVSSGEALDFCTKFDLKPKTFWQVTNCTRASGRTFNRSSSRDKNEIIWSPAELNVN